MKIAETNPPFCAACYGCYPDRRHIDFEAAWDGPVFEGEGVHTGDDGVRNKLPVGIDDLVICEDCLKGAAVALGWAGPRAQQVIEDLETRLEMAQRDRQEILDENRNLREIVANRKEAEQPPRPREDAEVPA